MPKDNLPEKLETRPGDLEQFTPPAAFSTVDVGSSEAVKFEALGDAFTGVFLGLEDITTEEGEVLPMASFIGPDGKGYCLFPNVVLRRGLAKVEPKEWCRITFDKEIDTGKPSPLKSYRVEVGRS